MPTRKFEVTDKFDDDVEERAKLLWLRAEVRVGLDQIERGEGIEFASIRELEAEVDRIGDEVERTGA
ncbi:MAG: hypothetical protein ACKV2U_23720 [Bryobacteraceae bacterium]